MADRGDRGEEQDLSCQAKQSISHTTVTFYGDRVKICKDWVFNHLALPFSPVNFFTKNDMTVVPNPPFKKLQKRWEWYIRAEGDYFEGNGGQ
jgi:hypothetical protein